MQTKLSKIFAIIMVVVMVFPTIALGQAPTPQIPDQFPPRPERDLPAKVPDDIIAAFEGGMSVEDFLAQIDGPIPNALRDYTSKRVTVVVEMEGAPLGQVYAESRALESPMSATEQSAYAQSLKNAQTTAVDSATALGGMLISQYTKAYNGFLLNIPANQVKTLRSLPGVVAVHDAPVHYPELSNSVPLIRADEVANDLGFDGTGMTIAVIDTGIDYTHAAFGGPGDAAVYADNDPTIITSTLAHTETFPTAKVIGGWDFAGTDYDAGGDTITETVPMPDPDPLDEYGHGTHVSSIAAGMEVSGQIGGGVAPEASLYALKVFGEEGSTNLTMDAIEWCLDPNGDGDLSDHVDVINMSLGSDYGPNDLDDPSIYASNVASGIGIVVVSSAGNASDTPYIVGSPADADSVIAVAASTTGYRTGPTVSISDTMYLTQTNLIYQTPDFDDDTGHFTQTITSTLFYAGSVITDTLCTTGVLSPTAMANSIALIQRGDCDFSTKVNNAASLGAEGAVIFNHSGGGNSLVTMVGISVTVPAGFIGNEDGMNLASAHGETVIVSAEDEVSTVMDNYTPPDTIANFSSRGPRGFDSILKPDVTAPGVGIFAADMGSGNAGVSMSGTSMASPHVAGVAALVRQAHPDWSPEQIKAALMNTAVDLADSLSKQVPLQGAGRVDAYNATTVNTFAIADPDLVSLNWGYIPLGVDAYTNHKNITLQNLYTETKVYSVTWEFGSGSFTAGFDMSTPVTVTVPGTPGIESVQVDLMLDSTAIPAGFEQQEEYYGYVVFSNTMVISDVLRVPFYAVPQPYATLNLEDPSASGMFTITHSGPITSSLWGYPLYAMDGNEAAQGDEGDVRMVGMDYGWYDPTQGDVLAMAIDAYGKWHTPQPYFAEFDLLIDSDGDGSTDFIDFNFNYGWFTGGDDTDDWVVLQLIPGVGITLGSPYLIYSDYNTGLMEWYLPTAWNSIDPTNTDFDFALFGYDWFGSEDFGGSWYFDALHAPLGWNFSHDPGPAAPLATGSYWIADPLGYTMSAPLGFMVVDYAGQAGAGQAYAMLFTTELPFRVYLPIVLK